MKHLKDLSQLIIVLLYSINSIVAQDLQWAKSMGSAVREDGICITTDSSGNILVIGVFMDSVDFDPGANTAYLSSSGNSDIFFAKYSNDGNYMWAKRIGGNWADRGEGIVISNAGNILISWSFVGTVDFDPGPATANLTSGGYDTFFAKYDSDGNFIWANGIGGTGNDHGNSIATHINGDVIITGSFEDTADFNSDPDTANLISVGKRDIFLARYDTDGNYLWAKSVWGTEDWDRGNSVTIDKMGNILVTGSFQSTADFDPDVGTTNLSSAGEWDLFIAKRITFANNGS